RENPKTSRELVLNHGSLLIMGGEMQHAWEHSVPKTAKDPGPRINLTFRVLP
ncbi:MAG: alpha-ketoglutarate-dependent dioxygenase AlkB, partial [Proteobacteria bacterium]